MSISGMPIYGILWYLCYRFGFDIDGIGFRRLRPEPVLVSASLIARQIDNSA